MLGDVLSSYTTEAEKEQYLVRLTDEHPYFAPAQFSLLQLTQPGTVAYKQRAATTALLFNNNYWLQHQLSQQGVAQIVAQVIPPTAAEPVTSVVATAPAYEVEPVPIAITPVIAQAPASSHEPEVAHPITVAASTMVPETPLIVSTVAIAEAAALEKDPLAFEPLHTVDYFASQGIKLSEEILANDKLGRQLRSFTDWLKTMKKTHTSTNEAEAEATQLAIQNIAARSNMEDEVLTEAMAVVYTRQGNRQKAIETYEKLSLLNPAKSAYFAAQIDNLKA